MINYCQHQRKEGSSLLKSNLNPIDEGGDVQKMEESDANDNGRRSEDGNNNQCMLMF